MNPAGDVRVLIRSLRGAVYSCDSEKDNKVALIFLRLVDEQTCVAEKHFEIAEKEIAALTGKVSELRGLIKEKDAALDRIISSTDDFGDSVIAPILAFAQDARNLTEVPF